MKHAEVKHCKVHVDMSRTRTTEGLGADHPENETTSSATISFFLSSFGPGSKTQRTIFCFVFFVATQLARQLHQERLQVGCSNKEAWKRLARRHSRNGPWTLVFGVWFVMPPHS